MDKMISEKTSANDVVNNCFMVLSCPKGRFYTDKNYGNSIKKSDDVGELLAAARQAVGSMDGVFIKRAEIRNGVIEFLLMINEEARSVRISVDKNI